MLRKHTSPTTARELKPAPANPRTISQEGLASLERSMRKYGDLSGIVFNTRTQRLIGGHQRLKGIPKDATITITQRFKAPTAKRTVAHGTIEVEGELWAYREVDADETWEKGANISANVQRAHFDQDRLRPIMADLQKAGEEFATLGFTSKDLIKIFKEPSTPEPSPTTQVVKDWTLLIAMVLVEDPDAAKAAWYGGSIAGLFKEWREESKKDGSEKLTGFYVMGWAVTAEIAGDMQEWARLEAAVALAEGAPVITRGSDSYERLVKLFAGGKLKGFT